MARKPTGGPSILRLVGRNPFVRATAIVGLTLAVGLLLRSHLKPIDVVMLFLLAVVVVAARQGRGPAVWSVALATGLFDFFFVPPYGTFSVLDRSYIFTFAVMFIVALIMTELTATIREHALDATRGQQRASALYEMIRELAETRSVAEQRLLAGRHLGRIIEGEGELALVNQPPDDLKTPAWADQGSLADPELRAVATWVFQHREAGGWGTTHSAGAEALVVPLAAGPSSLGVAIVRPRSLDRVLEDHELKTIEVLAQQAAAALQRSVGSAPPA